MTPPENMWANGDFKSINLGEMAYFEVEKYMISQIIILQFLTW